MLGVVLTLVEVPLWMLLFADRQLGVWAVAAQAVAVGVVTAALMTAAQEPFHRSVLTICGDLNRAQRAGALNSLRAAPLPADPVVLVAGIRLGTLMLGMRRQTPRWVTRFQWVIPIVALVLAGVSVATADMRRGLLYALLAVVLAVTLWFSDHTVRRVGARVELLRTQLVEVADDSVDVSVTVPPPVVGRRIWLAGGAAGLIIGLVAAMAVLQRPRTDEQCRVATRIVDDVLARQDLLLWKLGTPPQGPTVTDYQNRSDQLHGLAAQVSRADLAQPAQRIAELSGNASVLIHQTQNPGAGVQPSLNDAYFAISKQMLEETGKIQNICYRH